ncbi:hypothetical protein GCM10025771_00170 [Niveibacterium umoris]|uniref:Uncharacterized protein n=1 Tax=Niveibacterium umoris TaxID=1193620 RepID=A0A840BTC5_9RHOO|nr:peptidoglycan-binding domain-containing protein [Niveibacterium umoris]MBB4014922.1 hypothetical protein [Niveibacterium umoris]
MPLTDANNLDALGGWLDEARAGRHLPDPMLATGDASATNAANSALYLRAMASRLASLGYLAPDAAQTDNLTPALSEAIVAFQRDAGFSGNDIDGWAGPKTKHRLQQLVSFEEEQSPAEWGALGQHPDSFPAVRRAVYLRLYTLGYLDWDAPLSRTTTLDLDQNPGFRAGLQRFLLDAAALGLSQASLPPQLTPASLQLLFGHDALIAALASHPSFHDAPEHQRFIEAIGCVELWLLGYDVSIARRQPTRRIRAGTHGPRDQPSFKDVSAVDIALADFQEKFGLERKSRSAAHFGPDFFAQIHALAAADGSDDPTIQNEILARAATHRDSIVDKLGKLATRLWDGVKRLWGWLKRALTQAWGDIEDELWNLARFIGGEARKAYEGVLKAIDIVHHGLAYRTGRCFPGSRADTALLQVQRDFDAMLFVSTQAPPGAALDLVQAERHEARYFIAACRILQALTDALIEVLRVVVAGAGLGWFVLLLALSRSVREIHAIRDIVDGFDDYDLGPGSLYLNPTV